jgi:hypothetical protein
LYKVLALKSLEKGGGLDDSPIPTVAVAVRLRRNGQPLRFECDLWSAPQSFRHGSQQFGGIFLGYESVGYIASVGIAVERRDHYSYWHLRIQALHLRCKTGVAGDQSMVGEDEGDGMAAQLVQSRVAVGGYQNAVAGDGEDKTDSQALGLIANVKNDDRFCHPHRLSK